VTQKESVDDEEDAYRPVEHRQVERVGSAHRYDFVTFRSTSTIFNYICYGYIINLQKILASGSC
jgi:hypothetical protein